MKFFLIFLISFYLISCKKVDIYANVPHLTLKYNEKNRVVNACGSSGLYASYQGDTTFFAGFGCAGNRIVFYIKGSNRDGSYKLNNHNLAVYSDDFNNQFSTDSLHSGYLNLTTQKINGILMVKGEFEFKARDTTTAYTCSITNGDFLLTKY